MSLVVICHEFNCGEIHQKLISRCCLSKIGMSKLDTHVAAITRLLESTDESLTCDLHDTELIECLVSKESGKLADLVKLFLSSHGVYADETRKAGPPKFQYSDDISDSFDSYSRLGCTNCGSEFSLKYESDIADGILKCKNCGFAPAPLHRDGESDSAMDIVFQKNKSSEGIYIRGNRVIHDFGQNTKSWWQRYYLPKNIRDAAAAQELGKRSGLESNKGQRVKETCAQCDHGEAFFTTYQARSADEGMTILYECTNCGARKTFNN